MNLYRLKHFFLLIDSLIYFNLVVNKDSKENRLFFSIIDNFLLVLFLQCRSSILKIKIDITKPGKSKQKIIFKKILTTDFY